MAKPKTKEASFTDTLRARVREKVATIRDPGDIKGSEWPKAAGAIGITYSSLWRFIERGKGLSSEAIDKVVAWLHAEQAGERR
jgi:hypothetical protein